MQHRRFARFPTEIDGLASPNRRKVDQSQIDIFDDASERFDPVDEAVDLELQVPEARRRKRRSRGGKPLRVRLFDVVQRRIRFEQLDRQIAALRQQLLDERRNLWQ